MKIRLFGTVDDSIVDGPGLRYTILLRVVFIIAAVVIILKVMI